MLKKLDKLASYIAIIIGALAASFSVACILLPNDAIDYGTAGIAIIISKLSGLNLSLCVFLVLLPFFLAGMFMLGKSTIIKSLVGSIAYMVGLELFENIPFELNTEHFIAVVFGGAILGGGLTLILKAGGCIDGSEILANMISKIVSKKTGKNINLTTILILFNTVVYVLAFVLINRNSALLSLLVYLVATGIIDHYTDHFEAIKQVIIITKKPEGIIADLKEKLDKTCTIMESRGAIAGENVTLICYVNYFELHTIRDIISAHKGSFSTIQTIDEIIK